MVESAYRRNCCIRESITGICAASVHAYTITYIHSSFSFIHMRMLYIIEWNICDMNQISWNAYKCSLYDQFVRVTMLGIDSYHFFSSITWWWDSGKNNLIRTGLNGAVRLKDHAATISSCHWHRCSYYCRCWSTYSQSESNHRSATWSTRYLRHGLSRETNSQVFWNVDLPTDELPSLMIDVTVCYSAA